MKKITIITRYRLVSSVRISRPSWKLQRLRESQQQLSFLQSKLSRRNVLANDSPLDEGYGVDNDQGYVCAQSFNVFVHVHLYVYVYVYVYVYA